MAHIAKYKATSVGHMLAHYRRDASSLERDNIDPKRVKNDMVVAHYTNKDGQLVVGRVVPRELAWPKLVFTRISALPIRFAFW